MLIYFTYFLNYFLSKLEFKNYNKLTDDIFEILKYDDYFHLRTPQHCYLEYAGCVALCVANENLNIR